MSRSLRRYEILLPLRFNDGEPMPDDLVADTLLELVQHSGSPSTAMMSAYFPGSIAPRSVSAWSNSAATTVADRIACIGVIPYRTVYESSQQGYMLMQNLCRHLSFV
jgi:hypothetical protein